MSQNRQKKDTGEVPDAGRVETAKVFLGALADVIETSWADQKSPDGSETVLVLEQAGGERRQQKAAFVVGVWRSKAMHYGVVFKNVKTGLTEATMGIRSDALAAVYEEPGCYLEKALSAPGVFKESLKTDALRRWAINGAGHSVWPLVGMCEKLHVYLDNVRLVGVGLEERGARMTSPMSSKRNGIAGMPMEHKLDVKEVLSDLGQGKSILLSILREPVRLGLSAESIEEIFWSVKEHMPKLASLAEAQEIEGLLVMQRQGTEPTSGKIPRM